MSKRMTTHQFNEAIPLLRFRLHFKKEAFDYVQEIRGDGKHLVEGSDAKLLPSKLPARPYQTGTKNRAKGLTKRE